MTIRSEADIVSAVNAARDMTGVVVTFLKLWRKHANGINNVVVPDEPFSVSFLPLDNECYVTVGIFFTKTEHWETPTYFDSDDDEYVESYSSSANVSGVQHHREEVLYEKTISIPIGWLLSPNMEDVIIQFAAKDKAAKAEVLRQLEIAKLESQLTKLKSQ